MKKTYITPIMEERHFSYTNFICDVYKGSPLEGIRPQQEIPNKAAEPYSDNPNVSQVMSNERGFGSDSPWESLW